jgi:hypothetical protein
VHLHSCIWKGGDIWFFNKGQGDQAFSLATWWYRVIERVWWISAWPYLILVLWDSIENYEINIKESFSKAKTSHIILWSNQIYPLNSKRSLDLIFKFNSIITKVGQIYMVKLNKIMDSIEENILYYKDNNFPCFLKC